VAGFSISLHDYTLLGRPKSRRKNFPIGVELREVHSCSEFRSVSGQFEGLRRNVGASGSRGFSSAGAGTAEAGGWISHRKPLSKSTSAMVNLVSGGVTAGSAARRNSASLAARDF
jgi:hypothetical protein